MTRRSEAKVAAPQGVNIADAVADTPQNQSETFPLLAPIWYILIFRKRTKKKKKTQQGHFWSIDAESLWDRKSMMNDTGP